MSQEKISYRYRFGTAEFDEARFELRVDGRLVELERKPLAVLQLLLHRPGQAITREEFQAQVWTGSVTVGHVLGNAVLKLRSALGEDNAGMIVTLPRIGYRFAGEVERMAVGVVPESELSLQSGQSVPGASGLTLLTRLAVTRGNEVWRVKRRGASAELIFKFSRTGESLASLKREVTISRLLKSALPARSDFSQVIEWNFESAPFYIVSEDYGLPLDAWAQQDGRLGALSEVERLRLFLAIARPIEAAHAIGVLHKDIKPSNILIREVDGVPNVTIHDFGRSSMDETSGLLEFGITAMGMTLDSETHLAEQVGTLLYAAPEILQGAQSSVYSDQYSLGIILYQLLAGDLTRRFAAGWERDVPDALLREDVAKATDGVPEHRFSSVGALVKSLEGLEQRRADVEARKQAEALQILAGQAEARRLARRPLVRGLFAVLVITSVALSWLAWQANAARTTAQLASARAESVLYFLSDEMLYGIDAGTAFGTPDPGIRMVLQNAERQLAILSQTDPAGVALIKTAIGKLYLALSDAPRALNVLRQAHDEAAATGMRGADRAAVDYAYALALLSGGQMPAARNILVLADAEAGSALAQDNMLALASHQGHAQYAYLTSDFAEAIQRYQVAERLLTKLKPADKARLCAYQSAMADSYIALDKIDAAAPVIQRLQDPSYTPERVGIWCWTNSRIVYGRLLGKQGQLEQAGRLLEATNEAIAARQGTKRQPSGLVLNDLGTLEYMQGHWERARGYLVDALAIYARPSGPQSPAALSIEGVLGALDYRQARFADARQRLAAVYAESVRSLGDDDPCTQFAAYFLAAAESELGNQSRAQALAERLRAQQLALALPSQEPWEARVRALHELIACRVQTRTPPEGRRNVCERAGV